MASASSDSNVINSGSYGIVLYPALQNDPPYENDPYSRITKIFYRKEDYNEILSKKKRISKILGKNEDGYQFQTYNRKWKGKNIPEKAYQYLKNELNNNTNGKNSRVYPIHMLHMGKSLAMVKLSPEYTQQFRQCEIKHVIDSFKKLFDTITKLSKHHTIHGDIHSQNILIYMAGSFCEMYLIDYDLFESYDEMKRAYEVDGRDSIYGTPEVYHMIQKHKRDISDEKDTEEGVIRQYVARISSSLHFTRSYPNTRALEEQVRKAIDQHGDKSIPYHHIDSFMLCAVLLDIMYYMYPFLSKNNEVDASWKQDEKDALHKVKTILESGVTLSSARRSGPEEIKKEIERVLRKVKGLPSPPSPLSSPPSPSPLSPSVKSCKTHTNKNKKNNGCVISGGNQKKRTLRKTQKRKTKTQY